MTVKIRAYDPADREAVLDFSLRAWTPVFASIRDAMGPDIFDPQHPDWRSDQARAISSTLESSDFEVTVAEEHGAVVGFVATRLHPADSIGEIYMIAVDPDRQRAGVGAALTADALDRIAAAGMAVAMVETGADPGHAAARRTYEQAGFTLVPAARYFKALGGPQPRSR